MVRLIWIGWFVLIAGLAIYATVAGGQNFSQTIPFFALLGIVFVTLFFFRRR